MSSDNHLKEKRKIGVCEGRYPGSMPAIAEASRLSFAIFQTAKHHRALAGDLLRPLNLCPGQEILLMRLCDKDQQTQTELLECLQVEASTATKMVQRLMVQGLVDKVPNEQDKRSSFIVLTDEGRELKKLIVRAWEELDRKSAEFLSKDEYEDLCQLLDKVTKAVSARQE